MPRRATDALLEAARAWDREGLLAPGALATIEGRLAGEQEGPSEAQQVLVALAGVLVAAAAITLVALADASLAASGWTLWAIGWALLLAGFGLRLAGRGQLEGAGWVAGLVSLATGTMMAAEAAGGAWWGYLLAVALLVAAAATLLLPRLSIAAAFVAFAATLAGGIAFTVAGELYDEAAVRVLFPVLSVLAVAAWVAGTVLRRPWQPLVAFLTPLIFGAVFMGFLALTTSWQTPGAYEAALGAAEAAILAVAVWLRQRAAVVGAALVLAFDAIVFAFDVGGAWAGVAVLLATAAVLLWQAGAVRRYLRPGQGAAGEAASSHPRLRRM